MDFQEVLKKRASIRKFSSKKPRIEEVIKAIEASNLAPSPGNMAILHYIIIEKPETIEKISQACAQEFVGEAQFVVIICSKPNNVERAYDKRAARYVKHYVGAAVENFLLHITDQGLASCWVGAFSEHEIRDIARIPEDIDIEVILPVGYKHSYDKTEQRSKRSVFERVYFEVWKNKHKVPKRKIGDN